MGETNILKIITETGIGVGLVVVLCYISYAIIKHILKQGDNLLKMAMEQNEKWQKVIDEHTAQVREFHNQMNEASKYQRSEHAEIIKILGRINGYKE